MATASPPPPVNLWAILSESKRIINAHSRHFLALSVLFILPIAFSVVVYPSVFRQLLMNDPQTALLLTFAYNFVVTVFNFLAVGSIAYSVFQGFHGRPVKLIPALKSSFTSFFPLLATMITFNLIFLGISLILGSAAFLLTCLIKLILPDLELDYASPYFLAIFAIVMIISFVIMIRLSVDWILASVVVVVESAWGFTPLKRSKSLIKGMKSVSLSLIFFFAVTQSVLVWISTVAASAQIDDNENRETWKLWTNAFFVIQIVIKSAFLTLLTLYSLASITVLYMYCKAAQGELAWEKAEEFEREYVSLPFDDGKVPHLVTEAYNNV